MWRRLSDRLVRISTGRVTIFALVVFLVFTALVLPGQAQKASQETGGDQTPDLSFYYSPTQLYEMAESYGEEGRDAYIKARFTFDVAWPLVYVFFLATAISWLSGKASASNPLLKRGSLAPVFGAIFDFLENISTSLIMFRYPETTPVVDFLAPIFTMVKWLFVGGSFMVLLVLLGAWIWDSLSKKR